MISQNPFDIIPYMLKEWAQKRLDEAILRSRQFGVHRGLQPEGKPHFDQFIRDYKEGKQMLFYRYIHMLDGYDYQSNIHGLKHLQAIRDEPILIVANHPYADPLKGGHCQRILINHNVYLVTGKETRWLFGEDKTSPEHFMRKRFSRQSSTISVRDGDKKGKVMSGIAVGEALRNRDIIGINPEGDGNKTLLKANLNSATMIFLAAMHNYKIVCVATDFEADTFFMAVDSPLDNNQIREARIKLKHDQDNLRELVANYAMAKIALHLPQYKRGYYSNPQEHIDAFESLVATN